jgi:hypothetical protein
VTGAPFDATTPLPAQALAGAEALIHLAGESVAQRWTEHAKEHIRDSRVVGTRMLVDAAKEAGTVRHLVSASAVGYYGGRHGAEPLAEDAPPGDDFLAGVSRAWEAEALRAREAGIRTVLLRMGAVLHPEGGALHKMLPLFRMGTGGRVGSGKQYVSWIHREDWLAVVVRALEDAGLEGAFNVTAPEPVTNADFAHVLGEVLHRPAVMHVPGFMVRAAMGEMAKVVLEGQRVVPRRLLEAGFPFRYPDLRSALHDLLPAHAHAHGHAEHPPAP